MDVIFGSKPNITPPSVADTGKNSIETVTMVDEHIDDSLPNLGESLVDNADYSQDNMFEEREDGIEKIQHHSDTKNHDLSLSSKLSSNLALESTPTNKTLGKQKASNIQSLNPKYHKQGHKSTLASSYAELYESKKWHLEKEQKDKEQHMGLTIRENELKFAKDGKDKGLEARMMMADKDQEAIKMKEHNALLCAVVGSSRSFQEILKIFSGNHGDIQIIPTYPSVVVEDLVNKDEGIERQRWRCRWILLDFKDEGVIKEKLGGFAHQGQNDWIKITGATDL
ncbi:hypothetical protein BY996DRAFT_6563851 [Phakopsora pachyrhizi]|nr:hypothetical protein BY996DRAFT_6563851 [Phakopsora pachyrhizi]